MTDQEQVAEQWRILPDYPLYSISNRGVIVNNDTGFAVKLVALKSGSIQVGVSRNGVKKSFLVHRLVARVFLAGYSVDQQIEFIDGNKKNCRVENLRISKNRKPGPVNGLAV